MNSKSPNLHLLSHDDPAFAINCVKAFIGRKIGSLNTIHSYCTRVAEAGNFDIPKVKTENPKRGLRDFWNGVLISGNFLRPPNNQTNFFKDPK